MKTLKGVIMTMTKETRDIRTHDVTFEVRELEDSKPVITGYALRFNKPSEDLGFTEYLDPSCLDSADMRNVVALINHDSNYVLGRTGRNLSLSVDNEGLRFEIEPNDTTYVRDLIENMRTGLIDKCSFAFSIAEDGDKWVKRDDGRYERTVTNIDKLYDVSVVTTPAYEDTNVGLSQRSQDAFDNQTQAEVREQERLEFIEQMKRDIERMDIELDFQ